MYFRLKEEVFASPRFGTADNTTTLEKLLKEMVGEESKMGDKQHPK